MKNWIKALLVLVGGASFAATFLLMQMHGKRPIEPIPVTIPEPKDLPPFPVPAGTVAVKSGDKWQWNDDANRAYFVVRRLSDEALVSVIETPDAWIFVDRELVSVARYSKLRMQILPHYRAVCQELANHLPETLATCLCPDPVAMEEAVSPRTAERAAMMLARGPRFWGAKPLGYPSVELRRAFPVPEVHESENTLDMPLLGVCYADAKAVAACVGSDSSVRWQTMTRSIFNLIDVDAPSKTVATRPLPCGDPSGRGAYGIYFTDGGLRQIGEVFTTAPGRTLLVPLFGRSFCDFNRDPESVGPFDRGTDFGIRLTLTIPKGGSR